MNNNQTQKALPESIILRQKFNDADAGIRHAVRKVQEAYKALTHIEEFCPISTCIGDISEAWAHDMVSKRLQLIDADLSLTADEKTERKRRWRWVLAMAMKHVKQIANAIQQWPDAEWVFDQEINNFYCSNIDQVAITRSTFRVPAECKEHYNLIRQAIEGVRVLRQWEKDHEIKTQGLAYLQEIPPQQFVEFWANGSVKFDHSFRHLGIDPKNYSDSKKNDRLII